MAEKKEEQLSPEEKLLRVIQGSGPKRKGAMTTAPTGAGVEASAATAASAPAEAASPVAAGDSAASERQRLRLAKTVPAEAAAEPGPAPAPAAKSPVKTEAKAKVAAVSKGSSVSKRATASTDLSVRTLNIVLAGVILIVLLLTGHEIWANVKITDMGFPLGDVSVSMPSVSSEERAAALPDLDTLIDALDERALFAVATAGPVINPTTEARKAPPPSTYCSLLGISAIPETGEQEAIVMDKNLNKMMFLKVGDTVAADGQSWTVTKIQGDSVLFESGNEQSVVR